MHVSHHFKHFALQPKTSAQTRAARKKADIEGTGRVESRFAEDEEQEDLEQRKGRQGQAFQDGAAREGQAVAPAMVPVGRSTNVATPSIQVAPVLVTSPLDTVLASLINAAPRLGGSSAPKNLDIARESSLEDLLALMRAPVPKS